jgi:16S rRNA G966 N2-methylase RsmD
MKHISGIRRIIRESGFDNIKTIHIDVRTYLKVCTSKYDIVFADPPYDLSWLKEIPDLVTGSGVLKEDGFLILEHPKKMSFNEHKLFFEHRNYGGVNFSFFRVS